MSVNKNWELLSFIAICSPRSFKCIKVTKSLQKAFQEIAYNLLFSELPLTTEEIQALKKVKLAVKKLANKKNARLTPQVVKTLLAPTVRLLNGCTIHTSAREGSQKRRAGKHRQALPKKGGGSS